MVLVLPTRQTYWPLPSDFLGPWPLWLPWFFCLRQTLEAACVALLPVILRRRACYGGLARPAEFLALCAAIPFLADSIETALLRLRFRLETGQSPPGFGLIGMPTKFVSDWRDRAHWVREESLLLIGVLAIGGFLFGRRRLPGCLLTLLLVIAWLGAYEAGTDLASRWVFLNISRVSGRPVGQMAGILIGAVVFLLPRFVLYSMPAVITFRDVNDRQAGHSWLEWTALALTALLLLVAEPTEAVRIYSISGSGEPWAVETLVRAATMVIAIFLGFILTGNAGARRIAVRHGPNLAQPRPRPIWARRVFRDAGPTIAAY
jgi:hypothetical protein